MTTKLESYLDEHRDRFVNELSEWLAIPSVSVGDDHKQDMRRGAEWLAKALRDAGLEHVELLEAPGYPVVYADWQHAPGKPTAIVYGHYDVQPGEPLERWSHPPFEPIIKDGKLYARGATDDKGQLFVHVKAIEAMLRAEGTLPINLKFCIEGEEEKASPHLPAFLEKEAERFAGDVVVISDGPMQAKGVPSLTYGLRGIAALQVEVRGPNADLHSGLFGGGVANPIHALSRIVASFHKEDGRVAIAGFYDGIPPLPEAEREASQRLPFDEEAVRKQLGVQTLFGEAGYTFLEQTSARPTLEVHTFAGGYAGEGIKPIVPQAALVKLSCRLVGGQQPERIMEAIEAHIRLHTPPGVEVTVRRLLQGNPFTMPIDHPYLQAAARALETGFGTPPVLARGGGSIPVVDVFARLLKAPVILFNLGLPEENMHGPDEHLHLDSFDRGLRAVCAYWEELAGLRHAQE